MAKLFRVNSRLDCGHITKAWFQAPTLRHAIKGMRAVERAMRDDGTITSCTTKCSVVRDYGDTFDINKPSLMGM